MNFRIYNHVLEFPMVNRRFAPGRIDTRRTRRASGRVFRGDLRAAGRHPGDLSAWDTWRLGGLLGVVYCSGTRRVASSGGFRRVVSLGFGDTCHLPKGLRKVGCVGLVSERGFRKALSLGWHRVVRLEINGWDSSFRSGRMNCSERRWPSGSRWAATIDSLDW